MIRFYPQIPKAHEKSILRNYTMYDDIVRISVLIDEYVNNKDTEINKLSIITELKRIFLKAPKSRATTRFINNNCNDDDFFKLFAPYIVQWKKTCALNIMFMSSKTEGFTPLKKYKMDELKQLIN